MFKGLIDEVFKDYGLLVIDGDDVEVGELEVGMLKRMMECDEEIDEGFRGNEKERMERGLREMIESDRNVDLFLEEEDGRELVDFEDGELRMGKSDER